MNNYLILLLLAGMVVVLAMGSVSAADTYVNATLTTGTHTGESWDNAFNTIQEGVTGVTTDGTVFLAAGNYNGTGNKNIDVSKSFTIQGAGKEKTIIDAENTNNVLDINDGTITIKDLTIKNGNEAGWGGAIGNAGTLTIINCNFENNQANIDGGAICNVGTLEIKNSNFSNNNAKGNGGGIYNGDISLFPGRQGSLVVSDCTFTNNEANSNGGAIFNDFGNLNISGSTFTGNNAFNGGAIFHNFGNLTVTGTKFVDNTADYAAGAIWDNGGTCTITGSTFTDNTAEDAGAIWINYETCTINGSAFTGNIAHYGGAILNQGDLTAKGSTFTGNTAHYGGAIYNSGNLIVNSSTFKGNTAKTGAGGAVYLSFGSYEIISNHILNNVGSGIYIMKSLPISVSNGISKKVINFNRIYGNTPYGIYYNNTSVDPATVNAAITLSVPDARFNWWGSNGGPNSAGADKTNMESSLYTPWIVMKFSPSKVTINGGETTTIVANFLYDNLGGYHNSANGHIPDGTPVLFTTTLGQVGSQQITKYTVNGIANAILRALDENGNPVSGIAYITATTDAQTLSSQVTITPVVEAATVGMQETGLPMPLMFLAIIMVLGGLVASKRK